MRNLYNRMESKNMISRAIAFAVTSTGILFLAFGNVLIKNIGMYITMISFIIFFFPMILENDRVANFIWKKKKTEDPGLIWNIVFVAIALYILTFILIIKIVPHQ